jgi:two-component system CheB/CheR fusion protein
VKLGEDILLKYHTPPAVLIDSKMLCIYFYGETNKYLQISHGYNTSSILEMLPVDVRQRFAEAANTCIATNSAISVNYINTSGDENTDIILHSIPTKTETLLLTCFITTPTKTIYIHQKQRTNKTDTDNPQNLDTSLARTQQKLNATLDDLKQVTASYTSYKADTIAAQEELLSVNEELLSSKEELQSLNEELTTLNNQLQESLQNQRTTANDLQNVLISTNIATVFLDQKMCIRFFTPAAQRIFAFITTDIGRPITDIASIITDTKLTQDTQDVIRKTKPSIDRELESNNHEWFNRRIQPYREIDSNHTGVVVTYDDITERKRITEALYASIQEADRANSAKSRFLAMASHDLRQPLQALTLLHDLLAKNKQPLEAERLTKLLDNTLKSMTEMLDALLDINRIESGTIFPDIKSIPISDTIKKVADEYRPMCETKGISLRVVYNSAWVNTDPQLIEQIIRNLVSNAVKYTNFGGILIGCLRKGQHVSLRIYDTGIGFDETEREKIFEPYYQIEDPLKSSSEGLGLGLSIVNRLARLLDHQIQVTSQPNQGTCFMISLPISQSMPGLMDDETTKHSRENFPKLKETILLVEDDPALRDLLNKLISADGHTVFAMTDPNSAIQWASTCKVNPDVLLTDYDLSPGKNGLDLARSIRSIVGKQLPTIILTGDISSDTQRKLTHQNCDVIIKPAAPDLLLKKLNALMGSANENSSHKIQKQEQVKTVVHVIDDDPLVLKTIERLFKSDGFEVVTYKSAEHFLAMPRPTGTACLIVDMMLPKINGLELVELLRKEQSSLPVVMLTGYGDVDAAVSALKAGASNFLEKPAKASELLSSVREAVVTQQQKKARSDVDQSSIEILKRLTKREAEILKEIMKGYSNKIIATKLNVNQRTVENHRASVMRKCRVRSLAELIRLAISAGFS